MNLIVIIRKAKFIKEIFETAKAVYKYLVKEFAEVKLNLPKELADIFFRSEFLELKNGTLKIWSGYRWDGASGPAIDTENFMLPSLIHDALYQIIREGNYNRRINRLLRKYADQVLKELLLKEGTSIIRANYVYIAVRTFGGMWNK